MRPYVIMMLWSGLYERSRGNNDNNAANVNNDGNINDNGNNVNNTNASVRPALSLNVNRRPDGRGRGGIKEFRSVFRHAPGENTCLREIMR
ncbi:MAG: hypothetical protein IJ523_04990 [Succinivibrionaceae bacterium]|nr:hypothetical protein [Succinivibrionaceae bacterium]